MDKLYLRFRIYDEAHWGWRKLGPGRYLIDLGRLSILFERYK